MAGITLGHRGIDALELPGRELRGGQACLAERALRFGDEVAAGADLAALREDQAEVVVGQQGEARIEGARAHEAGVRGVRVAARSLGEAEVKVAARVYRERFDERPEVLGGLVMPAEAVRSDAALVPVVHRTSSIT